MKALLGCTVLSKCANPDCSEKFLFLHKGKLFHLAPTPEVFRAFPHIELSLQERFWLCDRCAKIMTVIWEGSHTKLIPLPTQPKKVQSERDEQVQYPSRKRAARAGVETA